MARYADFNGKKLEFPDGTPDEVIAATVKRLAESSAPSPVLSRGGAPASIGATPAVDRDIANFKIGGQDKSLSMRDVLEGLPNALAMAASFTPQGAGAGFAARLASAATSGAVRRVVTSGVLGFAGGGLRDMVRSAIGEQPTATVGERVVGDAVPTMAGQVLGEGGSLIAKQLPVASSAGMSAAAKELKAPAAPLSDSILGNMYTSKVQREAVSKVGDAQRALRTQLGPIGSQSGATDLMFKTAKEGESNMRGLLGNRFDAIEKPFLDQPVESSASLDLARNLPEGFKGVADARTVLASGEIPATAAGVRTVQTPFREMRNLSKSPSTRSMRQRLETDIETHLAGVSPATVKPYQEAKKAWASDVGDTFERGVLGKIFKDPQNTEAFLNISGRQYGRLAAVKKAIDSHPDPKVAGEAWAQFKTAKFNQLMEAGPSKFSSEIRTWDPKSIDLVFGKDAPAVLHFGEMVDVLRANPAQMKALDALIMSGKPPNFRIPTSTWERLRVGAMAAGSFAGEYSSFPHAGKLIAATEGARNVLGLVQNVVAHNPDGGLSKVVNGLDVAMKSGRTGAFWNAVSGAVRIGRSKKRRLEQESEEAQQ